MALPAKRPLIPGLAANAPAVLPDPCPEVQQVQARARPCASLQAVRWGHLHIKLMSNPMTKRETKALSRAAQGVVEARTLADAAGRRFTVALLARRSRLHPGMRYIARGLNALASPGNEIECEQLVWADGDPVLPDRNGAAPSVSASGEGGRGEGDGVGVRDQGEGARVRWSSFLWRRGTVPIWWGVELRSGGVGEANIVVSPSRPYRGTRRCAPRAHVRHHALHRMPGMQLVAAGHGGRASRGGRLRRHLAILVASLAPCYDLLPRLCSEDQLGTCSACFLANLG